MKDSLGCTYVILGLLLGSAAAYFDVDSFAAIRAQHASRQWQRTPGRIVASDVEVYHDQDGDRKEKASLRFEYSVGGVLRIGTRFRAADHTLVPRLDGSVDFARSASPGDPVDVHFDPQSPDRSALLVGLGTVDAVALVFLFILNLGAISAWCGWWQRRRVFARFGRSAGVPILEDGERLRLRLPRARPAVFALVAMLLSSGATLITLNILPSLDVSIADACGLIGGFCALGLLVWWRQRRLAALGHHDLVLDSKRAVLRLPRTFGRREDREVALDQIVDIEVVLANKSRRSPVYSIEVIGGADPDSSGGTGRVRHRLVRWNEPARGQGFVNFLKERIGEALGGRVDA